METLEINAETATWHLEKDGYLPTVLSIDNLSPILEGVGGADQCIAVLRPPTKTTQSASADEQRSDPALVGHWRFDEGSGSQTVSAPPGKAAIVLDGVHWEAGQWG